MEFPIQIPTRVGYYCPTRIPLSNRKKNQKKPQKMEMKIMEVTK